MAKPKKPAASLDSKASQRFLAIGEIEDDEEFIAALAGFLAIQFGWVNPAQRLNCLFLQMKYARQR